MLIDAAQINASMRDAVLRFVGSAQAEQVGRVAFVGDGIARVHGLEQVMSGELVAFEGGGRGIAMNLEADHVAVVLLFDGEGVGEGGFVSRTGQVAAVPVGEGLLGRVVDALGRPLDDHGPLAAHETRPIERVAPGVLARKKVDVPLTTGIKAIDAMVPIGRGQRQLIIGDRQTGKTAIAVDTILNQRDTGVLCVYVAVGQKNATVADIVSTLRRHGAMAYTTVVAAGAAEAPALQYFAPFSGTAMAEAFMESGRDVLIVYDDLSKHAAAYRGMSLLLRRPPGREAYPGDVFYLHSRLLERAGRMDAPHGGGSITALPIIETQAGNMAAYIPTNVISITDGQIYLETEAFNAGIRPAVNPGLSVSRVGGAAQAQAMRKIAAPLRTELAQYRELAAFAQFSADLDKDTQARLRHGERIVEILKQEQDAPVPFADMIVLFFAATARFFDDVRIEHVSRTEGALLDFFRTRHRDICAEIAEKKQLDDALEARLMACLRQFKAEHADEAP